jgi:hypothetical protein
MTLVSGYFTRTEARDTLRAPLTKNETQYHYKIIHFHESDARSLANAPALVVKGVEAPPAVGADYLWHPPN